MELSFLQKWQKKVKLVFRSQFSFGRTRGKLLRYFNDHCGYHLDIVWQIIYKIHFDYNLVVNNKLNASSQSFILK